MINLYKRTIVASAIAAMIAMLVAVFCEAVVFAHNLLLQNIMVGLACSLIVVIITSILQYLHEQKRVFTEYSSALQKLIFYLSIVYPETDVSSNEGYYTKLYDKIDISFETVAKWDAELFWFSINKKRKQQKIREAYSKMWVAFVKGIGVRKENAVAVLFQNPQYLLLVDAAKNLLEDKTDLKLIEMYFETAVSESQEKPTPAMDDFHSNDIEVPFANETR